MEKTKLFYIFGPQGAGKGTQAKELINYFEEKGFNSPTHVSSGEIFRKHIGEKTPLGIEAKRHMDKGNLVPDDLSIPMVVEYLKDLNSPEAIVLDGFPRTVNQHQKLSEQFDGLNTQLFAVILLEADEEVVVSRLSGRRTCINGHVFHVDYNPPKKEDVCDTCGEKLTQRDDDFPEAIKKRLQIYRDQTVPLIKELEKEEATILRANAEPPIPEVTKELLAKVTSHLEALAAQ